MAGDSDLVTMERLQEITQKSDKIGPYSSSRLCKVIHLGVVGKPICDFFVTLAVSATVFEILRLKDRKLLILPTLPCLTLPLGGTPHNFWMKLTPQNWRDGATVWCKLYTPNFNRFSMIHPSDRRTDRQIDRWTDNSIYTLQYTVSPKNMQNYFCYNYVKLPPNLTIFGTMTANCLKLYEVHSFSTSPNSRRCTTVLSADVPNCYITL